MSRGYGKGVFGSLNIAGSRNYKPLIAFVLIDELIFLSAAPIAGRLGVQMAVMTILWTVTALIAIIMWRMRFFRNAGFRAWVIVIAALTFGHLL